MENLIHQDIPAAQREAMLEATCVRTEEKFIKKYFTPEELTEMRKQRLDNDIVIKKANEVLKVAKDLCSETIAEPVKENINLLASVRMGFVEVNQQVYLFDDQDSGMMNTYDAAGEFVESRRLAPEERQTRIK